MTPRATLIRSLALATLLVAVSGARRGAAVGSTGNARLAANQPSAAAAALPPMVTTSPVASGAQLFQSPAALAAAAAAAANAALPGLAVQPSPLVGTGGAPVAAALAQSSLPAGVNVATNMLSPNLPSSVSARLDSSELLRQQQQQQGANQQLQLTGGSSLNVEQECLSSGGFISFELITGYVLSAPAESMLMQPGTLQLTDCLNICRQNSSCLAINFETGLCVLLQESADKNPQALQKSQFPVFTIYAHKICIQGDRANRCHKSWSFERVIGWVLSNLEKKSLLTKTRLECLLACYNEQSFQCKSFNYDSASGSCQLSDMDRHSLASAALRRRHYVESPLDTVDYGENNCIQEARGICDFKPLQNRILKTVDSIYQDIKSEPECRKRCLQAPYRCHSYDLGDSSNPVCRLSHLDRNSLQQIQDPYLEIQGALSYELDSCYNVTVLCRAREMVARVRTNKVFNGKIYAKNSPISCMSDISNSMDFELAMAFNDACSISRSANGLFSNEIVLQHNDMIVTNADIGLNVKCQYDLRNQTVYNNINLDDFMAGREPIDVASQSAVVRSPNISMAILRHDGNPISQAQVGDPLMLRFQITDDRSPFEIFVRDLYAMDGQGGSEIQLIDAEGCPTDPSIMAAMAQGSLSSGAHNASSRARAPAQSLEAQFDAFKFPTSETVAFRALVTPCIPHCEPVHCQSRIFDGSLYESESFGKRRRRRRRRRSADLPQAKQDEVLVRNSIEIKDKLFVGSDEHQDGQRALHQEDQVDAVRSWGLAGASALLFGLLIAGQILLVVVYLRLMTGRRNR